MRCDEFLERIQRLLDVRAAPEFDRALQAHAADCPQCQEILLAQQSLWSMLELSEAPEPPDDLAQRVVGQLARDDRRRTAWIAAVGLAAAGLMLALLGFSFAMHRPPASQGRIAASQTPRAIAIAAGGPASTTPVGPNGRRDDGPATETGRRAVSAAATPGGFNQLTSTTLTRLRPALIAQRRQVDAWAGELRPIADSFAAALDALKRSLLPTDPAPKGRPQAGIRNAITKMAV